MQQRKFCPILFLSLLFVLPSCSSTHEAYINSMRMAFEDPQNFVLSTEQVKQSPADLIYVKQQDSTTIILALAFIENGNYKWVSVDNAALIEKNGRIIKTISLNDNLNFIFSTSPDPLLSPDTIDEATTWHRVIDFNSVNFGVNVDSTFSVLGNRSITIQDKSIDTLLIEEQVHMTASKLREQEEHSWVNQFWLHRETGQLLRSKQKILPNGHFFDVTYVSRAVRL